MFILGVLYAVTIALSTFAIGGSIAERRLVVEMLNK